MSARCAKEPAVRLLTAAPRRFRWKERFESGNELGQILGDDLPNDVFVDAKVVVHDLVTHADDVGPLNFWMREAELAGHVASGFADDLHEVRQREAKIFVRVIRVAREACGLADGFFAVSSMCPT
jgi:hypothetical protein